MSKRVLIAFFISFLTGTALVLALVVFENPDFLTSKFWTVSQSEEVIGTVSGSLEDYKPVGTDKGVWNEGKASFWDFDIFDHFRIFGAKERARGYKPTQPIYYNHVTHVQKAKMECQYCHWAVGKSPFANIPEVQSCVGCHNHNLKINMGSNDAQKAEIAKIAKYFDNNEPVPWVKVHVMPDHVRFNHKRHLKAGVGCQSCHGQIPEMAQVERVSSMKMGWCIDCHREKGASIDCMTCHK